MYTRTHTGTNIKGTCNPFITGAVLFDFIVFH